MERVSTPDNASKDRAEYNAEMSGHNDNRARGEKLLNLMNRGDNSKSEESNFNYASALNEYFDTDEPDRTAEIIDRSSSVTPFIRIDKSTGSPDRDNDSSNTAGDSAEEEQKPKNSAVFVIPGFMAGENPFFAPIDKETLNTADVYAPDRKVGGFSGEAMLNGIYEIISSEKNHYDSIEIDVVSVGATIAGPLDKDKRFRELYNSGVNISLLYYDPFSIDDVAFGVDAKNNSLPARIQQTGIKAISGILGLINPLLPNIILDKNWPPIGEDTNIRFIIGQIVALARTRLFDPKTGKLYCKDYFAGTIEAGLEPNQENYDPLMDKLDRKAKIEAEFEGDNDMYVLGHAGLHGVTGQETQNENYMVPTEARKFLLKQHAERYGAKNT